MEKTKRFSLSVAFAICLAAVAAKLIFYYLLMGAVSDLGGVVFVTGALLLLFYNSFRNKLAAVAVYFFLSFLMLVDVTYYSFFNSYLSVNMVGAVGLLGDVQNSILQVLKPQYFLLLGDWLLIALAHFLAEIKGGGFAQREAIRSEINTSTQKERSAWERKGNGVLASLWRGVTSEEGRLKSLMAGFLAVSLLMLMNPAERGMLSSVLNQEFFTYHLKDASGLLDQTSSEGLENIGDILAISGNYDQEKNGPEFGAGKGKNLIVIQVEAMQNFVIGREYKGKEITPNINRLLKNDTFYFDTYYQQLGAGNTSDAEFATNNSLFGSLKSYTYEIYQDNYFRGLPVLLKEKGYETMAFHAFDKDFWSRASAYPGQGFDRFYSAEDFEPGPTLGMGLTDKSMFEQSVKILADRKAPFYAFMVTLSSHHPFDISGELDISEDTESMFLNYIQSMSYVDSAIGEFIEELKAAGLYENTIIAIYGDHFGLNPKEDEVRKEISEYLGEDYWYETAMNVPLVIHVPGCGVSKTVSVPGGQVDFLPTIAYLMGFDTLDTIHFGHNLLTVSDNFVPIRAYVQRGSFVAGNIMFQMSSDRIFNHGRAVNIRTGEEIPLDDLTNLYVKSVQLTNTSDYYLEQDILRRIYLEGESLTDYVGLAAEEAANQQSQIPYNSTIIDGAYERWSGDGVYSLERLDGFYDMGYREILVNMIYDVNGNCFVLKKAEDLSSYFQKPLKEGEAYKTYEDFEKAKRKLATEGVTPLSLPNLARWMEAHPDAVIVAAVGEEIIGDGENKTHSIAFVKEFLAEYEGLSQQMIFCVHSGEEVERANLEGTMNVLLDISGQEYTDKQMVDFISLYRVYAMAMTEEELELYPEFRKKWNGRTYVHRSLPYDGEELKKMGLTGVIQTDAPVGFSCQDSMETPFRKGCLQWKFCGMIVTNTCDP